MTKTRGGGSKNKTQVLKIVGRLSVTWYLLVATLAGKPFTMMLVFEVFQFEPDITGISCAGRFTLGTRLSETEAMIQSLIEKGARKLVLDLTHVDFVDSAGLGIIMRIFGEIGQQGGQFRIAGAGEQVRRLFDITHTTPILTIDDDLVTSIKKLQDRRSAGAA